MTAAVVVRGRRVIVWRVDGVLLSWLAVGEELLEIQPPIAHNESCFYYLLKLVSVK